MLHAPVVHLLGDRYDVQPWNLSFLELDDWLTRPEVQSEQVRPDGSDREIIHAISARGDLSVAQGWEPRWVLDVRLSNTSGVPDALIAVPETTATYDNATWWYDPADDGVDVVLAADLTGWEIWRARWSRDLEWVALEASNPSGVQGIYLWDVALSQGVPTAAIVDPVPFVPGAVDPSWGDGLRLCYAVGPDPDGNASGYVADLIAGGPHALVTSELPPNPGGSQTSGADRISISPDGTRVAYAKRIAGEERIDLFVAPVGDPAGEFRVTDDGRVRQGGWYTMSFCFHPEWSPDGTQLAFAVRAWGFFWNYQTWVIDVDGTSRADRITTTYDQNGNGHAVPTAWRN